VSAAPFRMLYVDDSGAPNTGYVVYSWIEMTPEAWNACLSHWLGFRKALYARYQIPVATELHTTKFMGNRARPSTNAKVNSSQPEMRKVLRMGLEAIGSCAGLQLGTVWTRTRKSGSAYHQARGDLYSDLVANLEVRLAAAGEYGQVFMDGDGSDPSYRRAHRALKLGNRRIIEDPLFQGAHLSQLVQMADMTAWTAYQSLLKHPGKKFCHDWYARYLGGSDINGGPLKLP